jgi:hypothetical protein
MKGKVLRRFWPLLRKIIAGNKDVAPQHKRAVPEPLH